MKNLLAVIACVLSFLSLAEARSIRATLVNSNELQKLARENPMEGPLQLNERRSGQREICKAFKAGCLIVSYQESASLLDPQKMGEQIVLQLDSNKLTKTDLSEVGQIFRDWKAGRTDTEILRQAILNRPRTFSHLKIIYNSLIKENVKVEKVIEFENIISQALLLTIDALYSAADYNFVTYPYQDTLTSPATLIDVNALYSKLQPMGLWPRILGLSEEERKAKGSEYTELDAYGNYTVIATFKSRDNIVYLDFSKNFYENVFNLYHEIWHVAYNFSTYLPNSIRSVLRALNSDQPTLRRELLRSFIVNETAAIDQQCRLFHATHPLADQWSNGEIATSARNWTYKCFGPIAFQQSKTYERRISPNRLTVAEALLGKISFSNALRAVPSKESELAVLNPGYYQYITSEFTKFFSKKILNDTNNIYVADFKPLGINLSKSPLYVSFPVVLTCDQVDQMLAALNGILKRIPFSYDTYPAMCPSSEVEQMGKDGSHNGKDGSTNGKDGSHNGKDGSHNAINASPEQKIPIIKLKEVGP